MLSKNAKTRISILLFSITLVCVITFLVLRTLEDNVVYFLSPTDIYNKPNLSFDEKVRVGGLVKKNTIIKKENTITFTITDLDHEIIVSYKGIVPNLFSEEKGVVAEGKLQDKKYFIADKILSKHDENYMPPEVVDALQK